MTKESSCELKLPSVSLSAEVLIQFARQLGKPLIMAMHPPNNDYNLKPGDLRSAKSSELHPGCDGLVVAIVASTEEMQELIDLVQKWQNDKESRS